METDNMDETVSALVSEIVQQSVSDLNELMQLIKHWEAEERVTSHTDDSATGYSTQQKIEEYLTWFFDQRRKFAEHRWDEENKEVKMVSTKFPTKKPDTLEEVCVREAEPTSSLSTISEDNRSSSSDSVTMAEQPAEMTFFKRLKKTWRKRFGRKKNNEVGSVSESQEEKDTKDRSLSLKSEEISISSKDQKEQDEDLAGSLSSFDLQQPITEPLEVRPTEEDRDHVTKIDLLSVPPDEEKEPVFSKEVTYFSTSLAMSEDQIKSEERESLASGASSSSKNIMKTEIAPFTTESPDTLEEVVFVADAEPTSSLSTISEDRRKSSSAYSPSSISAILEVTSMAVSQGTEQSLRTLQSTDSDSKAEQPAGTTLLKRLKKTWRKRFGRKKTNEDGSVSESQEDEDTKDRSLSLKSEEISTSLKDQKEQDEDLAGSLSSFDLQQPITEPLKVRPTEEDGDHVTKIDLLSGPPDEEKEPVLSKEVTYFSTSLAMSEDQIKSEERESLASRASSKNIIKTEIAPFTTESPDTLEEVAFVANAEPTSSLSTISEDRRKSSSAYTPSSTSAILEVTSVAVSQGTEQSVRTLESTDSDSKADQPARPTLLKRLRKTWRQRFGRKKNNEVGSVSESQEDEDTKDRSLSLKSEKVSTSLKDQKEQDEDLAGSLSSFDLQQPITEPLEVRPTEEDRDHVTKLDLLSGPPDEEKEPVLSKEVTCFSTSLAMSEDHIKSEERESLASGASSSSKNIMKTEIGPFTTESPDTLKEVVFVTEAEPTSSISTISEDKRKSSSASSPSSTSAILEVTDMAIAQGTDQAFRTLESTDSDSKAEQTTGTKLFEKIKKTWRKHFRKKKNEVGSVSESQEDEDSKDRSLCLKSKKISISSKDQKEQDEDLAGSLSSFGLQQPITEPLEVRPTEEDRDHVTKIDLLSGPPDEEKEPVLSKEVTCFSTSPFTSDDQIKSEERESLASGASSSSKNINTEIGAFTTESPDTLKEVVFVAEAEPTSSLSTISEDKRKSSSASSPSGTSAILEVSNVAVAQGTDKAVRTLESTDSDSKAEQPAEPTILKRLKKTWRKWFGRKKSKEDGSDSESQEDEDIKDRLLSLKSEQISTSSKDQKEQDEDLAGSLSSFDLQQPITEPLKVRPTEEDRDHVTKIDLLLGPPDEEDEGPVFFKEVTSFSTSPVMSEDQIKSEESESLASGASLKTGGRESPTHPDILEEVFVSEVEITYTRKSPSASSSSTSVFLESPTEHPASFGLQLLFTKPLTVRPIDDEIPVGPQEEEEDKTDSANDKQLVLNPSVFCFIFETFFQRLTEEQWREVSEGVYNHDVLEKLIDMCMTVLKFISNAVVKVVQLSLRQSSDTHGTFNLTSPMTFEHLLRVYNIDVQGFVESCFTQAVCDVIGTNTLVRVSPEFTDTLATEVLHEVNSVLSVTSQSSVDRASATPASSQESNKRASQKALAGLIPTMKTFLTGRATAVRRRIETQKDPEANNMEETPARGSATESKQSLWSRCVRRRERKIQPVPAQDLTGEDSVKEDNETSHSSISNTSEERTTNSDFSSKIL
ncbi:hypothetical protein EXN66_Car019100 [Channa argus]|uniref:Uncharacterized protein n=1 Tax=Channa argus TaxID=215402 RepID=A0A6G1QLH2_CHAAH|nr:hypothetical protein EXN66_Car019100 [Channa argus]